MSNIDRDTASAGGFGKMFTSLQGLQQRLEDFTIADVANAEANAQTLILRLRQVNDTIASVALLKQAAADIDRSLSETHEADLETIELDSLANHPRLHAIVDASKLIKLHKLMAALKASANAGEMVGPATSVDAIETALDAEPSLAHAADWADDRDLEIDPPVLPGSHDLSVEPTTTAPISEAEIAISEAAELSTPERDAEPDSPVISFASAELPPAEELTASEFPTADAEFANAVAAGQTSSSPLGDALTKDFPAAEESLSAALAAPAEFAANFPEPIDARDIAERGANTKPAPALSDTRSNHDGKALALTNQSFDLRLLDDLVSNYGEFAANPNLPATTTASAKTELQVFSPAAEAVESAQLKEQAAQPLDSEPVEPAPLPVRSTGDLDRQLKKIIKDYGEYDLYSDKPAANLKKAGIIAFVFLGLVFGGIYFFKTPPSTAKTAPAESNIESGAEANSQAGAEPGNSPKQTNQGKKN